MTKRYLLIALGAALLLGCGVLAFRAWHTAPQQPALEEPAEVVPVPVEIPFSRTETIGTSVEGRTIAATSYGHGSTSVLFVGGIHGGYEWNSVLLAYAFMDYLEAHHEFVPESLTITVIPNINPDGVFTVIGKEGRFAESDVPANEGPLGTGRLNAHDVDLNRNFDCKWAPTSNWRSTIVSAGTAAFSEPEAAALRDYVAAHPPKAAIFWHSQANAVYGSECHDGVLPGTRTVMQAYAQAAGYTAVPAFTAYPITGDAEGWLASIGIPAITVELATHATIEWERNLRGITALLAVFK